MSLPLRRKLYPTRLYLVISAALAVGLLLSATSVVAQYRSTRKEHKGPRAIAVIEFPTAPKDAKTPVKYAPRLIPAIILNEGKYFDASAYMATPVPMAIQPGIVYEAREAGESKGLFTIRGANADANHNWIASGVWDSAEAVAARADAKRKQDEAKKAREAALKEQAKDTGPPKLKRGGPDTKQPTPKPIPPPPPATDDDPDRPKMKRGTSEGSTTASNKPEAPEIPDPDAPELRRGKPAKDSPLVTAPPPAPKQSPAALSNNKLLAAISDATPDDDRSFLFQWKPEEQKRLTKLMSDLAEAELASTEEGDTTTKGSRTRAAKAKRIPLEEVQVRAYDPATNNEAVLVLTASSPMLKGATTQTPTFRRYVTLVAHVDLDNLPHKLFSSVTDDDHLDTVGILQLVDAVDSDGDGRAEFLFRRIGKYGQKFELYRSYGSQLLKLF